MIMIAILGSLYDEVWIILYSRWVNYLDFDI